MKNIITLLTICFLSQLSAQETFEVDYLVIKSQNQIAEHLSSMQYKNYKQLQYGVLLKDYYSLKTSYKGQNTVAGLTPIIGALYVPFGAMDILFMLFGEDEMPSTSMLSEILGENSKNKKEIQRKKREILSLYNSLK